MKGLFYRAMCIILLFTFCQHTNAQWNSLINKAKSSATKAVREESKKATESAIKSSKNKGAKEETITYGEHTYTMKGTFKIDKYDKYAAGKVTFTNIPSTYEEFESIYKEFLGKTPHGTAAMMPIAMEMYGRDRETGEKCIRLICYPSNVNSVLSILKEKFASSANDSYGQRYLPAAVLEGATPTNGYKPKEPYTINMNASVNKHQDMQMYDGRVMYIYIMGKGWDTEQRHIEIVKTSTNELFQVFNCPALYTQCKNIHGNWAGLK